MTTADMDILVTPNLGDNTDIDILVTPDLAFRAHAHTETKKINTKM